MGRQLGESIGSLTPASPFRGLLALLGGQSLDGEFDVLRDRWQKASFISGDRVPCHAEFRREFSLCETEVEPSEIPKCPTGQAASGYLREHGGSIGRDGHGEKCRSSNLKYLCQYDHQESQRFAIFNALEDS